MGVGLRVRRPVRVDVGLGIGLADACKDHQPKRFRSLVPLGIPPAAASSPAARRRTSGRRSAGYPPLRRPAAGSRAAGSQIGRARDTKGLYPLSDAVLVDEGVGRLLAWGER